MTTPEDNIEYLRPDVRIRKLIDGRYVGEVRIKKPTYNVLPPWNAWVWEAVWRNASTLLNPDSMFYNYAVHDSREDVVRTLACRGI